MEQRQHNPAHWIDDISPAVGRMKKLPDNLCKLKLLLTQTEMSQ